MMTVNAGRPVIELATACYHANIPLLLSGRHGIGKSEILEAAAAELKIGCVVYDLSIMEPPDLVGLPYKRKGRTVYAPPATLPTCGKGFIVIEELNRAPEYMRAPCLQLLTSRRLNDYELPPGWLPVAAINPPDAGYETSEMDPALLSRFVRAEIVPDREQWLDWARGAGVHPDIIAYVASDPSIFDSPESNPRAWTYVSKMLSAAGNSRARREILRIAVSGLVGRERQAAFMGFLKDKNRPLDADDVFDEYPAYQERVKVWAREKGRLDLLKDTLLAVMTQLQSKHLFNAVMHDRKRRRNLGRFLKDLPGDLSEQAERFFSEHDYTMPKTRSVAK